MLSRRWSALALSSLLGLVAGGGCDQPPADDATGEGVDITEQEATLAGGADTSCNPTPTCAEVTPVCQARTGIQLFALDPTASSTKLRGIALSPRKLLTSHTITVSNGSNAATKKFKIRYAVGTKTATVNLTGTALNNHDVKFTGDRNGKKFSFTVETKLPQKEVVLTGTPWAITGTIGNFSNAIGAESRVRLDFSHLGNAIDFWQDSCSSTNNVYGTALQDAADVISSDQLVLIGRLINTICLE
jgi:hypothetical protein